MGGSRVLYSVFNITSTLVTIARARLCIEYLLRSRRIDRSERRNVKRQLPAKSAKSRKNNPKMAAHLLIRKFFMASPPIDGQSMDQTMNFLNIIWPELNHVQVAQKQVRHTVTECSIVHVLIELQRSFKIMKVTIRQPLWVRTCQNRTFESPMSSWRFYVSILPITLLL